MKKKLLSVIVSCYNEEETVPLFYEEINKVSEKMDYLDFEFIFVNDGSKDKTLDILKKLHKKDRRVKYYSFSRNFGKEAAMYAGLCSSNGDYVTLMDADLQDPPSMLEKMYNYIVKDGYDCVGTRRVTRKGEPPIRSFFARIFYKLINKMSKVEMVDGARDYRLMTRQMVNSIINLREYNRFSKGIFSWVGFNTKWISFKTVDRQLGQTTWKFSSLFRYAIDGITCFSVAPLRFTAVMGAIIFVISLIYIMITLVQTLFFGITTPGYVTTLCAVLFLGGITEMSIGILGEYIGRIYMETKDRPIYITKFSNFEDENNEEKE